MPSSLYVPFLLAGMLAFGSSNSLFSKFQDMQCVEQCDNPDPSKHVLYEQPVYQSAQMFLGEMLCFLPVIFNLLRERFKTRPPHLPLDPHEEEPVLAKPVRHLRGFNILLLWIPAACDLIGTTLMNIGLLYTPVSIYQMTRGSLVLFVGAFSVIFLHRKLWLYQWISLLIVIGGVALVGWSGSLIKDAVKEASLVQGVPLLRRLVDHLPDAEPEPEVTAVLVGVFFILFAQVFTASQFVVEEKILGTYSVPPLVAVGWEGFFGFFSVLLLIPFLSIPSIAAKSEFFDLKRGWTQTVSNPVVLWTGVATAVSIAFFNFFGLSVTQYVSATARSLTDTCRTLSIWIVSLALGWEYLMFPISLVQITGFAVLVYGTFLFNSIVPIPPFIPSPPESHPTLNGDVEEAEGLLSNSTIDETAALPADLGQSGFDVVPEGRSQHAVVDDRSKRVI
ncbi:hypothetical protein DL96DRAFT_444653 [Flagelloscypha sp. PMI_526]|nr:hypothetical protein DL96DRAFT_444653 [Flagelloscypha sp. PMI_526]